MYSDDNLRTMERLFAETGKKKHALTFTGTLEALRQSTEYTSCGAGRASIKRTGIGAGERGKCKEYCYKSLIKHPQHLAR
jgi:hypothetical protein